ncbi:MAG: hypothetical protein LBQ81_03680 [Zoogloeaceae bacterium]|jgi:hypothetical protein|nr:hypothetical protein [Zoogloeaceae bacterium]
MSAPATAEYSLITSVILLAERAIAEAESMGLEYAETLENLKRKEANRQAEQQRAQAARAMRMADLQAQAEHLAARCLRLSGLTRQEEILPPAPLGVEAADVVAWSAYVRRLETTLVNMEARLDGESTAVQVLATVEDGEKLDLQGVLALYLAQRQVERNAAERMAWREMVERILARLELPPGEPLPAQIEGLARAVILAETSTRAELLGNELRREVQLYQENVEQARQDAAQAVDWLQRFAVASGLVSEAAAADDGALVECLQAVAAGLLPLDAATRKTVLRRVQEIDDIIYTREQKAAALVLEQSLQDLGYQVEAVSETLFAEGGMLHFQRSGWGGYHVRLRVNAKEKHFNFNVVRAKADDTQRDAAAQKKQDFIAEERWCAEFPRLLATLAARGLKLDIIRQLEAGDLPVQEVDAECLPRFATESAPARKTALKRFKLPGEKP